MLHHPLSDDVELRALEPWQAAVFAAHIDRHRSYLAAWLPIPHVVSDVGSAQRFLTAYAERQARDEGRIYGIWRVPAAAEAELIGGTVFRTFSTATRTCELGVWIAPEHAGRGLITAASTAMIDWAVHQRGIVRVEWRADAANTRSTAVAERLGMTCEGVLRAAAPTGEREVDVEVWAVLADEWSARTH